MVSFIALVGSCDENISLRNSRFSTNGVIEYWEKTLVSSLQLQWHDIYNPTECSKSHVIHYVIVYWLAQYGRLKSVNCGSSS